MNHRMPPEPQSLLDIRDVHVDYRVSRGFFSGGAMVRALRGVSFGVARGETLGLVGESGSGKSTLARVIIGLTLPTRGAVALTARNGGEAGAAERLRRIQMVFQDPYASLDPRQRIASAVAEPLAIQGVGTAAGRRAAAIDMLRLVGLDQHQADRFPHQFSGGQRQRIGIARALVAKPDILVCDEPVSALDVSVQAQIINLLLDLRRHLGLTVLFIAHDLGVVRHVASRIVVMYLGRIVEIAHRDAFFAEPLHPYSRALLSAVPLPDPLAERRRTRIVLQGETPSPLKPPSGCGFRTRCAFARPLCAEQEPPVDSPSPGRTVACHFWRDIAAGRAPANTTPVIA